MINDMINVRMNYASSMRKHVNSTTSIKIDKNIPIPPADRRGLATSRTTKYPFRKMQIGESFLFPKGTKVSNARSAAQQTARRSNMKFSVRQIEEGIRCWRIE